ncbi:uncharacterized protein N7500_009104 [Penicillium coprophilum]|uniref:uncharacterized protein n=1 Tax=Penicillium coprophilum TaxID=36646 RepID=UPI002390A5CB|nr:uncharacterized protein N7500_009104 [Penicillium coprophilum]KAJ5153665.1 hypothetical protein N7500_009104 [Penicillium coprophilum]
MGRPRRAAAQKPAGHYALTSATRVQKASATPARKPRKKKDQSEEDAMSLDTAATGPSRKSRKGKGRSEGDTMGTDMPPPPKKIAKGRVAALALDLKNSYEGKLPPPAPRPERQTRWRQPATNPIERFEDTPKGWNHDEPDLDPDDLESQIERCHERISDNIMVHQFQFKLQELLRKQTYRNEMMSSEAPGLSWPVVQRLKSLREMLEWLSSKGDEYESAANVAGLIEAYESGKLKYNRGLVTYWSHGVQLCEPRPFRWDECDLISAEHDGQKGFWVEGVKYGPMAQILAVTSAPTPRSPPLLLTPQVTMVYAFILPTTSPLSFQSFIFSTTHPSIPQSASTARHALRLALKAHKRLPRDRQDAHLPTVLSALNEYIPYLFAISKGLNASSDSSVVHDSYALGDTNLRTGEVVNITIRAEIESTWRPRNGRVSGRGIHFELAFTLITLGYVLDRMARAGVLTALYASSTPSAEVRTAGLQTATRYLLQASSVHNLLASSPTFTAATVSTVPELEPATQSALASLALAEATLLAVLKDDAYVAACIQSRNPNDKEWMVHAPEIPKVRALLFARLCVRAAEYAEQAAAGLGAVGSASGRAGRVDDDLVGYTRVLARVARARACRFFGVNAELSGKVGEGIAWLRAARIPLGLRGAGSSQEDGAGSGSSTKGGLSRLKREWTERREERRVTKDAGGSRSEKGPLHAGDDAGRDEEGRVLAMLETKWVKMNDTINTQVIPPSAPLLSNLPSGRDIHSQPAPYQPPSLDEDQLMRMRAPPDENHHIQSGSDDDSDDDVAQRDGHGPPGAFPDRSATASSVYY